MIRTKKRYLLTGLFSFSLIISLILLLQQDDSEQFRKRSEILIDMQRQESDLDREVLLIISLEQLNYDQITQINLHLLRLLDLTNPVESALFSNIPDNLKEKLAHYRDALQLRLNKAERLKYNASIVRNGLNYIPTLIQSMDLSDTDLLVAERTIGQLYRFYMHRSAFESQGVEASLEKLEKSNDPELHELIFHIKANLKLQRQLIALHENYTQIPSRERFAELHEAYLSYNNSVLSQISLLSNLLISLAIALIITLSILFVQLLRSLEQTKRAQARLKDGVDSLNEAFALFDGQNRLKIWNSKFISFYPWLHDQLKRGMKKSDLSEAIEQRALTLSSRETGKRMIQQLDNGKRYLVSDSDTQEGGEVWVRVDITESHMQEQELRKLSGALQQSPAAVVITDTRGIIEYINPQAEQSSGYTLQEVIGMRPNIFSSGDLSGINYQGMWETILGGEVWQGTFLNRRKSGELYWESATISGVKDAEGEITHIVAVKQDITERRHSEEMLRMNAAVFETTKEGIIITDSDTNIISVNPAFTQITGYKAEEVIGKTPQLLQSGKHGDEFYNRMWQSLKTQNSWTGEVWNQRKDGTVYPQWLSIAAVRNSDGELEQYVAVFSDMTQRKSAEEKIRHQANYDVLTGLPNRMMLKNELQSILKNCDYTRHRTALLFVDLDRFKVINDTLGHAIGDEMLEQVSQRLKGVIREQDLIARFGGDEFVIVLKSISSNEDAAQTANRAIEVLRPAFELAQKRLYIGASIGISVYPDDAVDSDKMLRHADMAMYLAKDRGRNQYQFFSAEMREHVKNRSELEQALRAAINSDQFQLYYQPICNCSSRQVTAVEALIRWNHPEKGLISPAEFIPLAEETGLIQPLGLWVFREACTQLKVWHDQGLNNLSVSINLSSSQRHLGFNADTASQIIEETGINAEKLIIEITESLFLDNSSEAVEWLNDLKALGPKLAIDDFGTGYSSLSYLKRFPIDKLKIDRTFVRDLPDDQEDASLVRAIIAMSHNLGLELIAEGVETVEQLEYLHQLDCHNIQGYLLSKPVPAERIPTTIRQIETQPPEKNMDYSI